MRINLLIINLLVVCMTSALTAQESEIADSTENQSPWTLGGLVSVTSSWTGFWNWSQGGQNSTNVTGIANGSARYSKGRHDWVSIADFAYGIAKVGEEPWRKNEDRIDVLSMYGYTLGDGNFSFSSRMNFRTQFANGYNLPNDSVVASKFLAPGYMVVSTGFTYRPTKWLTLLAHPAAGKITFVNDQNLANSGSYGVEPAAIDTVTGLVLEEGSRLRAEFGALASVLVKKDWEKMKLQSRADFFYNYTPGEGRERGVDITWETIFSYQIFKWLSVSFTSTLLFDKDMKTPIFEEVNGEEVAVGEEAKVQYKQIIGVGLGYTFGKRAKRPEGSASLPFDFGS